MPTNEQRRDNAKRKLERQMQRRVERARHRRRLLAIGSAVGVVVVIVAAVGVYVATRPDLCAYPASGEPASRAVETPDPNPETVGTVDLTLNTSQGAIGLVLDRGPAACGVNAVTSLAAQGFYDDTPCHRLVTSSTLQVLQCGDPTGSGTGGPGFQYAEEPPRDLPPSPQGPEAVTYDRGLVAMAKSAAPGTTGSQFFLVYGDSALPPEYTVLGRVMPPGLAVLDRVADAGGDNSDGPDDGQARLPVRIQQAVVSAQAS